MGLDVTTPDPPALGTDRSVEGEDGTGGGHRRDELQTALEDGAWERAFNEWAEHTDLTEEEFRIVTDLDLLDEFDFFWDDIADRVGYSAPGLPEDWRERDLHPDLETWGAVSSINASLTELGRTVADLLEAEYVDWGSGFEAPDDVADWEE